MKSMQPQDNVQNEAHVRAATPQQQPAARPVGREAMYQQYFAAPSSPTESPSHFIQQVDGFGVQVFAQASCFAAR